MSCPVEIILDVADVVSVELLSVGPPGPAGPPGPPGPAGGSVETLVAGEALAAGEVVALDTSGQVIRAQSTISSERYRPVGVATTTAANPGDNVDVFISMAAKVGILFTSPPPAADNGKTAWLSATLGRATMTPPVSDGNAVVPLGILQGADGSASRPDVMFNISREVLVEV